MAKNKNKININDEVPDEVFNKWTGKEGSLQNEQPQENKINEEEVVMEKENKEPYVEMNPVKLTIGGLPIEVSAGDVLDIEAKVEKAQDGGITIILNKVWNKKPSVSKTE